MSSAALQTAPHQQAALTPPLLASSPALQYTSSPSPPSREAYHATQYNAGSSSPQPRRPSRRPSDSGPDSGPVTGGAAAVAYAHHPQQHYPSASAAGRNPSMLSPPAPVAAGYPDRRSMPPIAPPRSSSQNPPPSGGRRGGGSSGGYQDAPPPHSHRVSSSHGERYRQDLNGRYDDASAAGGSRRHGHQESSSRRSSSRTRDPSAVRGGGYPTQQPTQQPTPKSSSREATEALNRAIHDEEMAREREMERIAQAHAHAQAHAAAMSRGAAGDDPGAVPGPDHHHPHHQPHHEGGGGRRNGRSRHDHRSRDKQFFRLGDYILGNTIGEGEFGKVRLGWKQQDGGNSKQYAIKLIKKDTLGENPTRLAKIWREVAILKRVAHPNIVKLIDTQDKDRYIGIILEYASGGELFDFILSQRSLKENVARRLFAQLVSGVGYLHKKGIVHRDLKLENLLLDHNRNIIITDFGFANTFEPDEALTEEEEMNLTDKEWVKKVGLDEIKPNGSRKGDLMQTSCGSPCYAAPELVISDSLYTGRKVDVWSCGVILYAMLAGYLPFDDDPANPDGDNINQLYRYIVSTPLTFPESVGPGARDLLRRILVPNPRKRADLFEVARHSWLSEFAEVVEFITSATTSPKEIQNSTIPAEELADVPLVTRSTSVRESSRPKPPSSPVGGLGGKHGADVGGSGSGGAGAGDSSDTEEAAFAKQHKDTKRRTVQVEYVAPSTQTRRGDSHAQQQQQQGQPPVGGSSRSRARAAAGQGLMEATAPSSVTSIDKPLPDVPPSSRDGQASSSRRRAHNNATTHNNNNGSSSSGGGGGHHNGAGRSNRDSRVITDNGLITVPGGAPGRSSSSQSSAPVGRVMPSQPVPPEVADAVAHGRIHQPRSNQDELAEGADPRAPASRAAAEGVPAKFAKVSGYDEGLRPADADADADAADGKEHRRSTTLGDLGKNILGRSGSLFGSKGRRKPDGADKSSRRHPPVSYSNSMPVGEAGRSSMDSRTSRRSISLGFGKKRSGSFVGSQHSGEKSNRRFSFLPQSFSARLMGLGGGGGRDVERAQSPADQQQQQQQYQPSSPLQQDISAQDYNPDQQQQHGPQTAPDTPSSQGGGDGGGQKRSKRHSGFRAPSRVGTSSGSASGPVLHQQRPSMQQERRPAPQAVGPVGPPTPVTPCFAQGALNDSSSSSIDDVSRRQQQQQQQPQNQQPQQHQYQQPADPAAMRPQEEPERDRKAARLLQKHKKFSDAYDDRGRGGGAARKVMALFRVRGQKRAGEAR